MVPSTMVVRSSARKVHPVCLNLGCIAGRQSPFALGLAFLFVSLLLVFFSSSPLALLGVVETLEASHLGQTTHSNMVCTCTYHCTKHRPIQCSLGPEALGTTPDRPPEYLVC